MTQRVEFDPSAVVFVSGFARQIRSEEFQVDAFHLVPLVMVRRRIAGGDASDWPTFLTDFDFECLRKTDE
jgi:hypothetical protein